jgi:hypothetical protein
MKKKVAKSIVILIIIISIVTLVNINVTTEQCINYKCHSIKIPLYLKVLDFFTRHYHYKQLVRGIIKDEKTDEGRVMKIFTWTYENIRKVPSGFPIIDDHVWHIIIRGYGQDDQVSDVFTTLCNYAGVYSFYLWVYTQDRKSKIPLSFVKIREKYFVFDPYHGIYFRDTRGQLADLETIKSKKTWLVAGKHDEEIIDYAIYFNNLPNIKGKILKRANIQSPFRRIIFEIKKMAR